jgi:hypothetical protein
MTPINTPISIAVENTLPVSPPIEVKNNLWQEIDLFFMQQGKVYETLQRLARNLPNAGIDYALIGGMALAIHGYVRLADVQELIKMLNLPQQLAEQIDISVRAEYLRLWQTVQPRT